MIVVGHLCEHPPRRLAPLHRRILDTPPGRLGMRVKPRRARLLPILLLLTERVRVT